MAGKVEQEAVSCSRLAAVPGERFAQGGGGGGAVPGFVHHRDVRSRHCEVLLQHLRERGRILRRCRKRLGRACTTAVAWGCISRTSRRGRSHRMTQECNMCTQQHEENGVWGWVDSGVCTWRRGSGVVRGMVVWGRSAVASLGHMAEQCWIGPFPAL